MADDWKDIFKRDNIYYKSTPSKLSNIARGRSSFIVRDPNSDLYAVLDTQGTNRKEDWSLYHKVDKDKVGDQFGNSSRISGLIPRDNLLTKDELGNAYNKALAVNKVRNMDLTTISRHHLNTFNEAKSQMFKGNLSVGELQSQIEKISKADYPNNPAILGNALVKDAQTESALRNIAKLINKKSFTSTG